MKKIGILGRLDLSGLGTMTTEFVRNFPDHIDRLGIVVRASKAEPGTYDLSEVTLNRLELFSEQVTLSNFQNFIDGLDVLIGFETYYFEHAIPVAAKAGVKTVLFPMWECSPANAVAADLLIATTDHDAVVYPEARHLDWPVDPRRYGAGRASVDPRFPARRLLCSSGWGGLGDRNNLPALVAAAESLHHLRGVDIGIRALAPIGLGTVGIRRLPAEPNPRNLYRGAALLIHLQGIPGLSLPLLEAAAVRLPALVLDLLGNEHYPEQQRVKIARYDTIQIGGKKVPMGRPCVRDLGRKLLDIVDGNKRPEPIGPPPTWEIFGTRFWPILEAL